MSALDLTSQLHRYTVEEYTDLVSKGAFEDQNVELVEGLVLDMSPESTPHANAIEWLNVWLVHNVNPDRHRVRPGLSFRLERSVLQPDLAVVDRHRRRDIHPLSAHLAIEVSLSSRPRDLKIKPVLYSAAVVEYWVFDLERRLLVVHRDPEDGGYERITEHGVGESVRAEHLELPPLSIAELIEQTF